MLTVNELLGNKEVYEREHKVFMENNQACFSFDKLLEENGAKIAVIMAEINNKIIKGENVSLEFSSLINFKQRKNILDDKFYFYAHLSDFSVRVNNHEPIRLTTNDSLRLKLELALDESFEESELKDFKKLTDSDFFNDFGVHSTELIEKEFLALT